MRGVNEPGIERIHFMDTVSEKLKLEVLEILQLWS